jgi:hypothetical protein
MIGEEMPKKPKKIVWLKTNRTRAKLSVGIGRERLYLKIELFGAARERVLKQIKRWKN